MADSTAGGQNLSPRRVTGAMLLNAFPALARRFKPVPRSHFATLDENERVVACPCHRRPVLSCGELRSCEEARQWAPHHAALGPCGRTFIATNRAVLVTGGKG
jgi:hypothetical protein